MLHAYSDGALLRHQERAVPYPLRIRQCITCTTEPSLPAMRNRGLRFDGFTRCPLLFGISIEVYALENSQVVQPRHTVAGLC
jgi:hypothetical protein